MEKAEIKMTYVTGGQGPGKFPMILMPEGHLMFGGGPLFYC